MDREWKAYFSVRTYTEMMNRVSAELSQYTAKI